MASQILVDRNSIRAGLSEEPDATAGYAALSPGESDSPAPSPRLVVRFAAGPGVRRRVMVTCVDADNPFETFQGMTGPDHSTSWPSTHTSSKICDAGDGVMQIAWWAPGVVIWVVSFGLGKAELRRFVDGTTVKHPH